MTAPDEKFAAAFLALTGNEPLSWQKRLYREHFSLGKPPGVIDLPTGLGKTMVMAIWLIARANGCSVPTRLIYVVDRHTVVDQATDLAEKLRDKCQKALGIEPPAISTLRGQLADNREWSADPSRPAIIIGTVDLIGSALLFSGYRSSYKRRPLEAGLLGQDSLLVLDEAHLSQPFEKLIRSISAFQEPNDNPVRVIRMSATSADNEKNDRFALENSDQADQVVEDRFNAKKRLKITTLREKEKLPDTLADEAIALAQTKMLPGKRVVVFVRSPNDAKAVATAIREHIIESIDASGPKPKKVKQTPYTDSVEVLTGTMRGMERDELVDKPVLKRFLDGEEDPKLEENKQPVFLVSTSAGEVGFDLNSDHLVGDEAPLDSWIQRLGRVNRRGKGIAFVQVLAKLRTEKKKEEAEKHTIDSASANAMDALKKLPKAELLEIDNRPGPILDASPSALSKLAKPENALSPSPTTVELTDILLDAWSMTSIRERMPGRPDVAPWLRGIEDEQAQTTVAWRAELEMFLGGPTSEKALQAIFARHRIRPHESLTVNTGHLVEFLKKIPKLKDRPDDLMTTSAAVRLARGGVVRRTLQQLAEEPSILYADSTLILPATFGGLDIAGMLDAESIPKKRKADDPKPASLDVADCGGYEQSNEARARQRILIERSADGSWMPSHLPGLTVPDDIKLQSKYVKSTDLFRDIKAADLRVRLVQPIEFDEEGDAVKSLVILAPAPKNKSREDQPLAEHIGAVEEQAMRIADALGLAENDPFRIALLFAAKWHDEGKKAHVWQVFANNPNPDGDEPLGKMAQSRDPKSLRGYRHEFGSLLRIHHPTRCNTAGCELPGNLEARELALHLIATHHGAGRPHFGQAIYDPFTDAERDDLQMAAVRRFARLQSEYGWWRLAWLENLLRCADSLASADEEVTEIDEDDSEGGNP